MNQETIQYYDKQAAACSARYNRADVTALHEILSRWLHAPARVLEIGCGSGRDASFMASALELEVVATDASSQMIELAQRREIAPAAALLSFRRLAFPLPQGHDFLKERFDAVVAIAVVMHLPDAALEKLADQVRTLTKPGGVFICSTCSGKPSTADDPRLFAQRESADVQLLVEQAGFKLASQRANTDGLGRDKQWTTLVFLRRGD